MNYFDVFGLERTLRIDTGALQRRFYELSRQWHPDRQHGADAAAQADALERSALVNAAYRALRDPIARIEYLLRLEDGRDGAPGGGDAATVKQKAPAELLEEMFEVQEMLAEARAGGLTPETRERLTQERDRLAARREDVEARLTGPLSDAWENARPSARAMPARPDGAARALAALREALAERAYLRTVIDDLTVALDPGPGESEGGVSPPRMNGESAGGVTGESEGGSRSSRANESGVIGESHVAHHRH